MPSKYDVFAYGEVITTPLAKLNYLLKGYLTSNTSQFFELNDVPTLRKSIAKNNKDPNTMATNISDDIQITLEPFFNNLKIDLEVVNRENDYVLVMQIIADNTTYDKSLPFNEAGKLNKNLYMEAYNNG